MARDVVDGEVVQSRDALASWFEAGCKPAGPFRVGIEHEKIPFYRADLKPVPYVGERGIRALLEGMNARLGWERIEDGGHLIGLYDADGGAAISLEPGGQFELSGAPLDTAHQSAEELDRHLGHCRAVAGPLDIGFLTLGMSPKWTLAETPRMPKSRYDIMKRYMPRVGARGLDMMFRTATVQANLDYRDEADMVAKLRVGLALQPAITALFANSPFTDGKPNGFLSMRSEIWRHTDRGPHRDAALRLRAGHGLRALRRLCPRRADVLPQARLEISRRRGRELSRSPRGAARRRAGREGDDGRLGEPFVDDFSRGAAQALSRDARRRRRAARANRRAVSPDDRPLLRQGRA